MESAVSPKLVRSRSNGSNYLQCFKVYWLVWHFGIGSNYPPWYFGKWRNLIGLYIEAWYALEKFSRLHWQIYLHWLSRRQCILEHYIVSGGWSTIIFHLDIFLVSFACIGSDYFKEKCCWLTWKKFHKNTVCCFLMSMWWKVFYVSFIAHYSYLFVAYFAYLFSWQAKLKSSRAKTKFFIKELRKWKPMVTMDLILL